MLESIPDFLLNDQAQTQTQPLTANSQPPMRDSSAPVVPSSAPSLCPSTGSPSTSDPERQSPPKGIDVDVVLKRQRNTIAARKYRQKRLDRISELEVALDGVTKERDDLRIRLARQEAETAALKEMMRMTPGKSSN